MVTICALCQQSNKHGSTRCWRCLHVLDAPPEIVRTKLAEKIWGSRTLFRSLVITDVGLVATMFIAFYTSIVFLGIFGMLTVMAKQQRDMWQRSALVFAEKHPELPKATIVSQ